MMDDDECGAINKMIGGEAEVLRENLSQCHFGYRKSHMT
jgi:hypothetical protein